jgi:hypothetical protein
MRQRDKEHHHDGSSHKHTHHVTTDVRSGWAKDGWHLPWVDRSRRDRSKRLAQSSLKNVVAEVRHDNSFRSVASA